MFRATHVSDTHGDFPRLGPSLMIFHTGDFIPNISRGVPSKELPFQEDWVNTHIKEIDDWVGGRLLVYNKGNHDFFDMIPTLTKAGIRAIDVTDRLENIWGMKVFGFPHIPYIQGEWNYETQFPDMVRLVSEIPEELDILMAHCPPAGILGEEDWKMGNTSLANWLSYQEASTLPKALFCGHFHGSHGITLLPLEGRSSMLISNAATTVHNFELPWW